MKKKTARKPARLTPAKREANRRVQANLRKKTEAAARRDRWGSASEALRAWRNGDAVMVKINGAGA